MSLNESLIEEATLQWFGELGYSCLGAEALTPTLSHGERESYGEVVQFRCAQTFILTFSQREKEKRVAILRLNPAMPEDGRATIERY